MYIKSCDTAATYYKTLCLKTTAVKKTSCLKCNRKLSLNLALKKRGKG